MVSIGGDRATNEDYRLANRAAVKRSQPKTKREPKARSKPTSQPRVLGQPRAALSNARAAQSGGRSVYVPPGPAPKPQAKEPEPFDFRSLFTDKRSQASTVPTDTARAARNIFVPTDRLAPAAPSAAATAAVTSATQPGVAPAAPPTTQPKTAGTGTPPEISDGVRELLNARNWTVPEEGTKVRIPKSSYEKGGVTKLLDHDYSVTEDEWNRIEATYSTPAARAAGFAPPTSATKKVDDNTPLMNMAPEESAALTWDAYEKLSTDQRAAVDFNTLLVQARQKDLKKKVNLNAVDRADYGRKVVELFGEGRGSDTVAPNTVDLLDQLDMKVVGQDLDEYLSLERSIDDTELKDFHFSNDDVKTLESLATGGTPQTGEQAYAAVRTPENLAAVDTAGIQRTQQMIKTALQNPQAMTYDFNTLVNGPSEEMKGQPPMGFGNETTKWKDPSDAAKNQWFQTGLTILGAADPAQMGVPAGQDPMNWLLGDLDAATQGDEKTRQQFIDYIANTTQLVGQYGSKEDATLAAMINKRAGLGG